MDLKKQASEALKRIMVSRQPLTTEQVEALKAAAELFPQVNNVDVVAYVVCDGYEIIGGDIATFVDADPAADLELLARLWDDRCYKKYGGGWDDPEPGEDEDDDGYGPFTFGVAKADSPFPADIGSAFASACENVK